MLNNEELELVTKLTTLSEKVAEAITLLRVENGKQQQEIEDLKKRVKALEIPATILR